MSCIKLVVATLIVATTVPSPVRAQTWTLQADRIYTGPDAPPLDGGQIIMVGDKIDRIDEPSQKPASSNTGKAPQCDGGIAMAGFQNSHVHFTSDDADSRIAHHRTCSSLERTTPPRSSRRRHGRGYRGTRCGSGGGPTQLCESAVCDSGGGGHVLKSFAPIKLNKDQESHWHSPPAAN